MSDSGRNEPRKLQRKSPGFTGSGVGHELNATGREIEKKGGIINTGRSAGVPKITTLPNPVEGGGVHNALNADLGGKIKLQCTTVNAGAFAWSSEDPQHITIQDNAHRNRTTIPGYSSSSCPKKNCEKGSNVSGVAHALNATSGGSIEGERVIISAGLGAGNPNITNLPKTMKGRGVHDALNTDLDDKINLKCAIINAGALVPSSSDPQDITIQRNAAYRRSHTTSSRCASSSCSKKDCDHKGSNVSGVAHALNATGGGSIEGKKVIINAGLGAGNPNITALPNHVIGGGVHDALNADLNGKINLECAIVNAGALARSSSDPQDITIQRNAAYRRSHTTNSRCASSSCSKKHYDDKGNQ